MWLAYALSQLWWIIPAAIVVGFLLLFAATGLWEKQHIVPFEPLAEGEAPAHMPYTATMNDQVRRLGFVDPVQIRHVKCGTYNVQGSAWFSPDRTILAFIVGGKIARLRLRRTLLYTRLPDGRLLTTTDELETAELTGLYEREVLANADLVELFHRHRARIVRHVPNPQPFTERTSLDALLAIVRLEAERTIERGWGAYADPAQSCWRYTVAGVLRLIPRTFRPKNIQGSGNIQRASRPRPGDARYAEQPAQSILRARPLSGAGAESDVVAALVEEPANVSWNAQSVRFKLNSPHVAVFDPMMLDVLREEEVARGSAPDVLAAAAQRVACREPAFACVTLYPFQPGLFQFDPDQLETAGASADVEADTVVVDSGALFIADVMALPRIAAILSWEKYDEMLQAGGNAVIEALIDQLGDPCFAIIHADAERTFRGDGRYRVRRDALRPG